MNQRQLVKKVMSFDDSPFIFLIQETNGFDADDPHTIFAVECTLVHHSDGSFILRRVDDNELFMVSIEMSTSMEHLGIVCLIKESNAVNRDYVETWKIRFIQYAESCQEECPEVNLAVAECGTMYDESEEGYVPGEEIFIETACLFTHPQPAEDFAYAKLAEDNVHEDGWGEHIWCKDEMATILSVELESRPSLIYWRSEVANQFELAN